MRDTMTLKEAAAALSVSSTHSVRRILSLHTDEGREKAHAGYDAAGRHLVRRDVVMAAVRQRARDVNWRVANLGAWAEPRTGKKECSDQAPVDTSVRHDAFTAPRDI